MDRGPCDGFQKCDRELEGVYQLAGWGRFTTCKFIYLAAYFGQRFDDLQFDHLILAAVEPTKLGTLDSVSNSLNLMKRLQYMLDQSLRTSRMLDLNIEVMKRMQTAATKAKYSDATEARRKYEGLIEGLESAMNEHIFLRKNVSSLVERASILSTQVKFSSYSANAFTH